MKHVILCDETGNPQVTANIEEAHTLPGKLHRAFSVFVFRNEGKDLLIQKRIEGKLFGGLWANTCCSHPQEGGNICESAQQRLKEECGFTCPLKEHSSFVYRAEDPKGKGVEHEYDTILVGKMDSNPNPNPTTEEVAALKWASIDELQQDMSQHPERFAPWFPLALERILEIHNGNN